MRLVTWMMPMMFTSYQLTSCKTSVNRDGQASLESQAGDGNIYVYAISVSGSKSAMTAQASTAYGNGDLIPFGLRSDVGAACIDLGTSSSGNGPTDFYANSNVVLKEKLSQQQQQKLNTNLCNGRCKVTFEESIVSLSEASLSMDRGYSKKPLSGLKTLDLRMSTCDKATHAEVISHMGSELRSLLGTDHPRELALHFVQKGNARRVQLLVDRSGFE